MTQALPTGIKYGSVRWTTVGFIEDSVDVDALPDPQQVNGTVFLKPNAEFVKYLGDGVDNNPKTILNSRPSEYQIVNGVLKDKSGNTDIRVIASVGQTEGATAPIEWNWHCDFQLDDGFTFGSFDFDVVADDVVDLTFAIPQVASNGTPYVQGPPGPQGDPGPAGPGVPEGGALNQMMIHNGLTTAWIDSATAGTASTVMRRDSAGRTQVAAGSANADVVNKGQMDTALAAKANLASPTFTGTVGGITKSMVGLANVDNTADSAKPVSTAQQTALNGKANTSHTHATADVTGLDTALAGKAAASHIHAQSDVTGLSTSLAGKVNATAGEITDIRKMTQAAYDALGTKVATTLYVIVG